MAGRGSKKRTYNRTAVGAVLLIIGMFLVVLATMLHRSQNWYLVAGALGGLGFGNLLVGLRHRDSDRNHNLRGR